MGFTDKMKERKAEHDAKNAGKQKNYTMHIVGTILVVAIVICALLSWFPLH